MSIEDASRIVTPLEAQLLPQPLEIPEALQGPIPYPKGAKHTRSAINTYQLNWKLAVNDLRELSQTPEYGPSITSLFEEFPEEGIVTELHSISPLVGVDDSHVARQVRSELKLARLEGKATDHSYWKFTREEIAQYMTGLIAKKKSAFYAWRRKNPNQSPHQQRTVYNQPDNSIE